MSSDAAFVILSRENMELKRKISALELEVAVEKSKRTNLLSEISAALESSEDEAVAVVPAGVDVTFDYSDSEECGWCGVSGNPCLCEMGLVCGATALATELCPCFDCNKEEEEVAGESK